MSKVSVLFVCLGNICRSPTAHGVFQGMVDASGLGDVIAVDSAGTGDWHIGRSPDQRTAQVAASRGYDLSELRARLVTGEDFDQFDYVIAMDRANLQNLESMRPPHFSGYLGLFLDFACGDSHSEVPDPYYGGESGFELVFDLVEDASRGLLEHIRGQHQLAAGK